MMDYRKVQRVVTGVATQDGAGVKLTRVLGKPTVEDFDPFLMLDAFDSRNPADYIRGFPWHPHRGIETVTYLLSGDIEHGDSTGNHGSILSGDCQWMTAGSGIIHQEMPRAVGHMKGTQLWINLPAASKMTMPLYNSIMADSVPVVGDGGASVKVIAGRYKNKKGAFEGKFVKATYLDVSLAPGAVWEFDSIPDETLFVYIYGGGGWFEKERAEYYPEKRALLFTHGKKIYVEAGKEGAGFLLLMGKPLKEPVAWGGPIVMNTEEELEIAFHELDDNTFIKEGEPDRAEAMP